MKRPKIDKFILHQKKLKERRANLFYALLCLIFKYLQMCFVLFVFNIRLR